MPFNLAVPRGYKEQDICQASVEILLRTSVPGVAWKENLSPPVILGPVLNLPKDRKIKRKTV